MNNSNSKNCLKVFARRRGGKTRQENRNSASRAHLEPENTRLSGGSNHSPARPLENDRVEPKHASTFENLRSLRCCSQGRRCRYII